LNDLMTKLELIEKIKARRPEYDAGFITSVVEMMMGEIGKCLEKGEAVTLRGFGTFSVKQQKAKKVRNFKTGTVTGLPARYKPHWKPSPMMVRKVDEAHSTETDENNLRP